MAYQERDSDYVVGLVAGWDGTDIYLMDRVKGQWAFSETCRQVEALSRRYPGTSRILIEDAANGPAIIDALTARIRGIIVVHPAGGKIARAQAAQPRVRSGATCMSRTHVRSAQRKPDGRGSRTLVTSSPSFPMVLRMTM